MAKPMPGVVFTKLSEVERWCLFFITEGLMTSDSTDFDYYDFKQPSPGKFTMALSNKPVGKPEVKSTGEATAVGGDQGVLKFKFQGDPAEYELTVVHTDYKSILVIYTKRNNPAGCGFQVFGTKCSTRKQVLDEASKIVSANGGDPAKLKELQHTCCH